MHQPSTTAGPDRRTLIVFVFLVIIGGSNAVAVRFSNAELAPFWGASLRFLLTAAVFWTVVLARKIPVPAGAALRRTIVFGLFSIGLAYAFLYQGLVRISSGMTMTVLAFVPLLTLFLAVLHRQETFRWRGLVGATISIAGILVAVWSRLEGGVHLPSLLAVVAGAFCMSEANVIFKTIPRSDPFAANAIAVSTGGLLLLAISLISGDAMVLPRQDATWQAVLYLVLIGSVLLFYLYIYVLTRWTASATAYAFMLFPISTVLIAAVLEGEPVTLPFAFGVVLVIAGVWVGAFSKKISP